jgi:hypothetical protein
VWHRTNINVYFFNKKISFNEFLFVQNVHTPCSNLHTILAVLLDHRTNLEWKNNTHETWLYAKEKNFNVKKHYTLCASRFRGQPTSPWYWRRNI